MLHPNAANLLSRRRKKKKNHKISDKWEDPNIRERLLAGAYGGVTKKKKRNNRISNTNELYQGLADIPVPVTSGIIYKVEKNDSRNMDSRNNSVTR